VVWTALIGHAFLDAYDHFQEDRYLQIAVSACQHIVRDLGASPTGMGICINYIPIKDPRRFTMPTRWGKFACPHLFAYWQRVLPGVGAEGNAVHSPISEARFVLVLCRKENHHWVDNFHTGYVLDCFKYYMRKAPVTTVSTRR
jgi:polysaccharide biosynthesis protein VpsJ